MQTQTIFRAGNSNVVAIPKDIQEELGLKRGQKVVVEKTPNGDAVIKKVDRANRRVKKSAVSEEFEKWLDQVLKEDAEILDELALR